MKMLLTGTGTSFGVPCIACNCRVCTSTDSHDKRLRTGAYLSVNRKDGSNFYILIDIGPEFRIQALKYKINAVDLILITHSHADHLHGLDDIRIFSHTESGDGTKATDGKGLTIFANSQTIEDIKERFSYIFKQTQAGGGKPKIQIKEASVCEIEKFSENCGLKINPINMLHGNVKTAGWLFSEKCEDKKNHSIAYLTDCNFISEEEIKKIQKEAGILEHLIIDGLRIKKHVTHFSFLEALEVAEKLKPNHTWLTHICHSSSHKEIEEYLQENLYKFPNLKDISSTGGSVKPAYDGLELEI